MVRSMIDDRRESFPTAYAGEEIPIVRAINDAQLEKIRFYYDNNEERALRTLYRFEQQVTNGSVVSVNGQKMLYARSVVLYESWPLDEDKGVCAKFLDVDDFNNFGFSNGFEIGSRFPREAYYTATSDALGSRLLFTAPSVNAVASLWFICQPIRFAWDKDGLSNYGLELPAEFHIEVCSLAAEKLNDLDVLEIERSGRVFQNEFVTMESAGNG